MGRTFVTRTRIISHTSAPDEPQLIPPLLRRWLDRIGAMLRHEVSNPLQAILSEAQLLATSPAARDPDVKAAAESIERAARRIASVVAHLETVAARKLAGEFDAEHAPAPSAGLTRALAEELNTISRFIERPLEPAELAHLAPRMRRAARLAQFWLSATDWPPPSGPFDQHSPGWLDPGGGPGTAAAIALADRLERSNAAYHELKARHERRERYWRFAIHELRNAAHAFLSWISSLRQAEIHDAPWFEPLRRAAETLLRRAEEALDPAAPDRGTFSVTPATVDLLAAVQDVLGVIRPTADLRRLTLEFTTPDSGQPIEAVADLDRLQQILHNLLRNAIQATPPGGSIRVSARCDAEFAVLEVEDSGPGVPPHAADAIFRLDTPYDIDSPRGSGLGLPLSRSLAEQMGGSLTLEPSGAGSGARFVLKLPRSLP